MHFSVAVIYFSLIIFLYFFASFFLLQWLCRMSFRTQCTSFSSWQYYKTNATSCGRWEFKWHFTTAVISVLTKLLVFSGLSKPLQVRRSFNERVNCSKYYFWCYWRIKLSLYNYLFNKLWVEKLRCNSIMSYSPQSLFQGESMWEVFVVSIGFHSYWN